MTRLALRPEPAEHVSTVWTRSQLAGVQSNLTIAAMHAVRSSTKHQLSGSGTDLYLSHNAIRDCREALDELESLLLNGSE